MLHPFYKQVTITFVTPSRIHRQLFRFLPTRGNIPRTGTFIEKGSSINEEIERLRLSTMISLFSRRDVIGGASGSCINGIGSNEHYAANQVIGAVGGGKPHAQLFEKPINPWRYWLKRETQSGCSIDGLAEI